MTLSITFRLATLRYVKNKLSDFFVIRFWLSKENVKSVFMFIRMDLKIKYVYNQDLFCCIFFFNKNLFVKKAENTSDFFKIKFPPKENFLKIKRKGK